MILAVTAILALTVIAIFAVYLLAPKQPPQSKTGMVVAVTFYSLKPDLEQLICSGDSVFSVTPPGVDPHEYQLTPSDVAKLRDADIIVSTAHTPFETQIRDLVSRGEIKSVLIEIPNIPGVSIKLNPATGQPNYHWPIYDPENYKIYMAYVEKRLETLRPECAESYRANLKNLTEKVSTIENATRKLNLCAVATSPPAQYAVEWAGIRVKYLLVKEEDLPATPEDLARIESSLSSGECKLIVVVGSTSTQVAQKALELAASHSVPYIVVPDPTAPDSALNKIFKVSQELTKLAPSG
ncbi:metal ABC transporter substrate-binding protein [Infirmifilum sp. NZ]|uniref:metal ABC transporter substrate-binding protein n=1 Tax=Infirmifilum sp. NZ TaxID=2926850 RepID=UPI0027A31985|nr:zinc ABC transporter substrate-binding protein [Infirmifilum sp. NZ]UNQ74093.1 zinc ABC transporter substrate-binding protein [Infirmifilum sp. NZ]